MTFSSCELLNWLEGFVQKPKTVFINHGDDASVLEFQKLLQDRGYAADAPYSGTEYDLLTGRMTVYSEGKPIDRVQAFKGSQRAKAVYDEMVAAAEELLALVKARKGRTNKDNAKLTGAIRSLIEKWRN